MSFWLPEFLDNQHIKVVMLSALYTGCLDPQEILLLLISVRGLVDPWAKMQPEDLVNKKSQ